MIGFEYKSARKQRGTQQGVANALGVALSTVQRREAGEWDITEESRRAILSLPLVKKQGVIRRPNAVVTNGREE